MGLKDSFGFSAEGSLVFLWAFANLDSPDPYLSYHRTQRLKRCFNNLSFFFFSNGIGVRDLIPQVVEDEAQQRVVVGVDRVPGHHQVEDLLVQEVADDMVSTIDHRHTGRPEGKI